MATQPYSTLQEAQKYKKKLLAEDAQLKKAGKKVKHRRWNYDDYDYSPEWLAVKAFITRESKRQTEQKEELRKERLKNTQCVLIANMNELVRSNGVKVTEERNAPAPKKKQVSGNSSASKAVAAQNNSEWGVQRLARILPYMGTPESVLGRLLNPVSCAAFVNAPTPYFLYSR